MSCEHKAVDWKHDVYDKECPTCVEQDDICDAVICADCKEIVDQNTLTDEQERHLFRTA
jgi:hypothetical protein